MSNTNVLAKLMENCIPSCTEVPRQNVSVVIHVVSTVFTRFWYTLNNCKLKLQAPYWTPKILFGIYTASEKIRLVIGALTHLIGVHMSILATSIIKKKIDPMRLTKIYEVRQTRPLHPVKDVKCLQTKHNTFWMRSRKGSIIPNWHENRWVHLFLLLDKVSERVS